jgi:hypothetical protein
LYVVGDRFDGGNPDGDHPADPNLPRLEEHWTDDAPNTDLAQNCEMHQHRHEIVKNKLFNINSQRNERFDVLRLLIGLNNKTRL